MIDDRYTESLLWIAATRYHLGRRTYAVSDYGATLIRYWDDLTDGTRAVIQHDVEAEFERDDRLRGMASPVTGRIPSGSMPLGDDCDRRSWEKVRRLWAT